MKYLLKQLSLAISRVTRQGIDGGILTREKRRRLKAFLADH